MSNMATDWSSLTLADLQRECRCRNLLVGGNKKQHIARLQQYEAHEALMTQLHAADYTEQYLGHFLDNTWQLRLPEELWAKHVLPHLSLRDIGTITLVHKELRANDSAAIRDVHVTLTKVHNFQTDKALLLETAVDIRRLREDIKDANAAYDDVVVPCDDSSFRLAVTFRAADLLQEQTARQNRLITKKRKVIRLLDSRIQEYFEWYSANMVANLLTGNISGLSAGLEAYKSHLRQLHAEGML
ncbi:hypothetical protein ABBQ32_002361 [Trebouxia sp. C0010 RCD-2024]